MLELKGKYNIAKVYTDNIDTETISQVTNLCNQEFVSDSKICIMPDTHAGAGCVIGTTMTIKDKIVPNLVGVDIGCGMHVVELDVSNIDFKKLDEIIRSKVPSGNSAREYTHKNINKINIKNLKCYNNLKNTDRLEKSLGTLGGGNHFIEVNEGSDGKKYLVIHSGSRNLGKQVAEYYQNIAIENIQKTRNNVDIDKLITQLKTEGREQEISKILAKTPKTTKLTKDEKDLAYLEDVDMENYLHDMDIAQKYATINRETISEVIAEEMGFNIINEFTTIHNYIDLNSMILRKGAVSAQKDEILLVPINMRDGSLLCKGKGNSEWNYSAPHGAGRIYSRSQAKEKLNLEDFQKEMEGIYTTSVLQSTLDEAPMAYKPLEEIISNTKDTMEILDIIKPLYNYKAN